MRQQETKVNMMCQLSDAPGEQKAKREGERGIMDEPDGFLNESRNPFSRDGKGRWGIWKALGIPYDNEYKQ